MKSAPTVTPRSAFISGQRRAGRSAAALVQFQRDRLGFLRRMARRGDVVRFDLLTQPVVLLNHPDLARSLLAGAHGDLTKSPVLRQARIVLGEGLLTSEGAAHRRHRRLVQPAFDHRHLRGYAAAMVAAAADESGSWRDGGTVDAAAAMHRVALQIASRTLFGADTRGRAGEIRAAVSDLLGAYQTALLPFGGLVRRLPLPQVRRLQSGLERIDALVAELVAARRAGGETGGEDLLSLLLEARDDGARLSDAEVRDEAVTLLLAGHETTAAALAWALHHLAADPAAQDRIRSEVRHVAGSRDLGAEHLDGLIETRAAVAESLRLHPPSWAIARQASAEVTLSSPAGEVPLAPGDVAIASPYLLHRDARWWHEPERFAPERWRASDSSSASGSRPIRDPRRPRPGFLPFGAGPRRCIGEPFAWMEATLVLATLLRRWHLQPTGPLPREVASLTLRPGLAAALEVRRHHGLQPAAT